MGVLHQHVFYTLFTCIVNVNVVFINNHVSASWDGVTKPQISSENGNLIANISTDFVLIMRDRDKPGNVSFWDFLNSVQDKVTGECSQGKAISKIYKDGNVECSGTDLSTLDEIRSSIEELKAIEPCELSDWSEWSECDNLCEGTQTQTRQIIRNASEGIPCSRFDLTRQQSCGGKCDDFCGNNERWFYLNSGLSFAQVSSYTDSNRVVVRRPYDLSIYGGRGHGRLVDIPTVPGNQVTIFPVGWGWGSWRMGDYMCGQNGSIEVLGWRGNLSLTPDVDIDPDNLEQHNNAVVGFREWVPERLAGKKFAIPVPRYGRTVHLQIFALEKSTVTIIEGNETTGVLLLSPYETSSWGTTSSWGNPYRDRLIKNFNIESTGRILITYCAQVVTISVGQQTNGLFDYMPIIPAAKTIYGIPSMGFVTAIGEHQPTLNIVCNPDPDNNIDFYTDTLDLDSNEDLHQIKIGVPNYKGPPCKISVPEGSDAWIGAISAGDSDGMEATMWMPASLMRKTFILAAAGKHLALTCIRRPNDTDDTEGGIATFRLRKNYDVDKITINLEFENGMAKGYIDDSEMLNVGTYITTSHPCSVVMDDPISRELTVFGIGNE